MDKKFLPGEIICEESDLIRGHGTLKIDKYIGSTIFGYPILINKLLTVQPVYKYRYIPEIGHVVVGRVNEIGNKKWKIDLNSTNDVSLSLSSILLPGSVQRRKVEEDEMNMREYFDLNDILVAEVQKVNKQSAALHTRNEKYKKLTKGTIFCLPVMLIPRMKSPFLENSWLEVIIGANGYVYLGIKVENKEVICKLTRVYQYLFSCRECMTILDEEFVQKLIEC